MPRASICTVNVGDALRINELTKLSKAAKVEYRCTECNQLVKPHNIGKDKKGRNQAAHFEHFKRNTNCSLSAPIK